MSGIHVYNKKTETHEGSNVYDITRPSVLSNPFTHIQDTHRTQAKYVVPSRDEAIARYGHYFDTMYNGNLKFKEIVDEIYEKFKNGEDVYLGCVCKPLSCHGDIIAKKLTSRLVREEFLSKRKRKLKS